MFVSTSSSAEDNRYLIVHEYSGLNSQARDSEELQTIRDFISRRTDLRSSRVGQTHGMGCRLATRDAGARGFSLYQRLSEHRGSKAALLFDHHSSGSGVSPSGIPVRLGASLRPCMSYSTQTDLDEINVEPAIVRKYSNRYSV
jgi:hypothetical protein